jgi:hypothetical protein
MVDLSMILFITVNIYQLTIESKVIDRATLGTAAYAMFFIADALFLAQHWVFASEYLECAATIKPAFSLNMEDLNQRK